jgi:glutathione S-transferase
VERSELAERLARVPSKERREAWLRTARKPYTEEERAEARNKLKTALLDRMEDAIGPSGWLVGDRYSLADIGAVPFVKRIDEEIAPDEMTRARHPKVTAWWAAIQARPAFAAARIEAFTGG